jgi:hypothetical protein
MAKLISSNYAKSKRKKRPGIHAKSKTSKMKNSVNYKKKYRGQGKG